MGINYLFGKGKAQINAFLSAAAWNLKKFMERLKKNLSFLLHFFTRLLEYFLGKKFPVFFALKNKHLFGVAF
ncbi:MAG: hypothetical protein KatS3mg034_0844 [Vicingaceae bacterium]|nr:MAG: hypothetical protein KatS3mg034_0844 [Vicingaceae bacterium]